MKKLYDLAVKTGSYTNGNGDTKNRYVNIGAIMEKEDGGRMIFLNRTFNPAGVPTEPDRESIIVSMFAPKKNDSANEPEPTPPASDSDIPF
jgi:hypothetical protein